MAVFPPVTGAENKSRQNFVFKSIANANITKYQHSAPERNSTKIECGPQKWVLTHKKTANRKEKIRQLQPQSVWLTQTCNCYCHGIFKNSMGTCGQLDSTRLDSSIPKRMPNFIPRKCYFKLSIWHFKNWHKFHMCSLALSDRLSLIKSDVTVVLSGRLDTNSTRDH